MLYSPADWAKLAAGLIQISQIHVETFYRGHRYCRPCRPRGALGKRPTHAWFGTREFEAQIKGCLCQIMVSFLQLPSETI